MLEFAQPLTIKGKDGERWTLDGSTLQDTKEKSSDQLEGNKCKQQI